MSLPQSALTCFFEYDTPKIVHIRSKGIGCTNRLLQLLIVSYVVGFAIVYQKGYQSKAQVQSAVTTKVKGVFVTRSGEAVYNRVWDPVDYVYPTYGGDGGGFFVATSVVITVGQRRGVCAESPSVKEARCRVDADCVAGEASQVGNGVYTGRCVFFAPSVKTCEVEAWCPVENEDGPWNETRPRRPLLVSSSNSTVLIKNVIEFPEFGASYKRRNILETSNATYLQSCVYDPATDPFCPVFRLGGIVEAAGEDYSRVAVKGGLFQVEIRWDCDLDWGFMEYCVPVYAFQRVDKEDSLISPGWNFRSAEYHSENNRTLFKNYGIKFMIKVSGVAGKFDLVPLAINLGSGLALLGLASIFCDLLVLNCVKYREYYKENKYLVVSSPDGVGSGGAGSGTDNQGLLDNE